MERIQPIVRIQAPDVEPFKILILTKEYARRDASSTKPAVRLNSFLQCVPTARGQQDSSKY